MTGSGYGGPGGPLRRHGLSDVPATRATGTGVPTRRKVPPRSITADLRAAVPDAIAAMVLTLVVYAVMWARVRAGTDPAAQTMGASMGTTGIRVYTISQAFGFAALAWSWGTILLGLSVSTRLWAGRPGARMLVERLHRSTSLTVIALMLAHAITLLWDNMSSATPLQLFVPFASSYAAQRLPLALGILALYGALLLGPTFYLRDRLGPRTWRVVHRVFIPLVYGLGVWHTFARGEDLTAFNPLWIALWAMQVPVIIAFTARMLVPARPGERLGRLLHRILRQPTRPTANAAVMTSAMGEFHPTAATSPGSTPRDSAHATL